MVWAGNVPERDYPSLQSTWGEEVFDQIKDKSRKAWHDFKAFTLQKISMRATLVTKPSSPNSKISGRRRKLQHLHCGIPAPKSTVS
jgi:hypothetical protein